MWFSTVLTIFNPLDYEGDYSATLNNTKLVHWPLMGGLLHLVQWGGPGWAVALLSPFLTVPIVTGHPSTTSVPVTVLLYDGPLLCGFNVAIKGLMFLFLHLCMSRLAGGIVFCFPPLCLSVRPVICYQYCELDILQFYKWTTDFAANWHKWLIVGAMTWNIQLSGSGRQSQEVKVKVKFTGGQS